MTTTDTKRSRAAPVFQDLVLEHTARGRNQIGAVGNPYVQAENGVIDQYLQLQCACRDNGLTLAGLIVSSKGHWFWSGQGKEGPDDYEVRNICMITSRLSYKRPSYRFNCAGPQEAIAQPAPQIHQPC